jgi:enamine deaminase RidA (YjgF/YER057c/UK114 family)
VKDVRVAIVRPNGLDVFGSRNQPVAAEVKYRMATGLRKAPIVRAASRHAPDKASDSREFRHPRAQRAGPDAERNPSLWQDHEASMIKHLPGPFPTRSRAVIHNGYAHAVSFVTDRKPDMYLQTKSALAHIDATLKEAGTDKSRILKAIVYIADMARKPEMNRAWDEWADRANPPMRACVAVDLQDDTLVEIVVDAVVE